MREAQGGHVRRGGQRGALALLVGLSPPVKFQWCDYYGRSKTNFNIPKYQYVPPFPALYLHPLPRIVCSNHCHPLAHAWICMHFICLSRSLRVEGVWGGDYWLGEWPAAAEACVWPPHLHPMAQQEGVPQASCHPWVIMSVQGLALVGA